MGVGPAARLRCKLAGPLGPPPPSSRRGPSIPYPCGCTLSVVPCDAAQGLYSTVYVHEHPVSVFCEFYDTGTSTARPAGHGTAGSAGFHDTRQSLESGLVSFRAASTDADEEMRLMPWLERTAQTQTHGAAACSALDATSSRLMLLFHASKCSKITHAGHAHRVTHFCAAGDTPVLIAV